MRDWGNHHHHHLYHSNNNLDELEGFLLQDRDRSLNQFRVRVDGVDREEMGMEVVMIGDIMIRGLVVDKVKKVIGVLAILGQMGGNGSLPCFHSYSWP